MKTIEVSEGGLRAAWEIAGDGDVRLVHFGVGEPAPAGDEKARGCYRMLELQVVGENQHAHHGQKHLGTAPANRLKYRRHRRRGSHLEFTVGEAGGLEATVHYQFAPGIPVARCWTEVVHRGREPVVLDYVSSFVLTGLAPDGAQADCWLSIGHNTWFGEAQWRRARLTELGFLPVGPTAMKRLACTSTGTWPADGYLPMGVLENARTGQTWFWQIEATGSWHWEVGGNTGQLYLALSGPTGQENQWAKRLLPGESFTSVPVAVGAVAGDFTAAIQHLTRYRRAIRRPNADNETLPVIFNDYMNCLFGDPTTEKLKPLIDAAADVGCEYFCIDCGWYSDGWWWDGVGEWLPSAKRFPGGIREPLDYIRARGMIPGLWLELEVMGINCPLAARVPDDWFFQRHGRRVIDHARYQLDFRNPAVIAHADEVVDRLVRQYGVGYIKMDYNINAGVGTDYAATSAGDGLLEHNRAYLRWLDQVLARYPDLVMENCGSGGLRMTYGLLDRLSIQSTSDQTDYRKYAAIAAACATAVTPEQAAVWSYPLLDGDEEEVICNMVNALLLRIHQSGPLASLRLERLALVREGIATYKQIRADIKTGLPFWPLGVPTLLDRWVSFGLDCGAKKYLAVWRLAAEEDSCLLPGVTGAVRCLYPSAGRCDWKQEAAGLRVRLPQPNCARLFVITG